MLVPFALVIALGWLTWHSYSALVASFGWVSHTLEVESHFVELQAQLAQADSAQRGFLLTWRPDYLQPFEDAIGNTTAEQAELRKLTEDDPEQIRRLGELQDLVTAKVAELKKTLALAQAGQHDAALRALNSDVGEHLSARIRREIGAAIAEERRLLDQRQAALRDRSEENTAFAAALVLFAALIAAASLYLLWWLQRHQALVHVCAWSKTIEHDGEWISFDDYLEKRFGLRVSHGMSPEQAKRFRDELDARYPSEG
jgi:CHASE3 domain sensor protein